MGGWASAKKVDSKSLMLINWHSQLWYFGILVLVLGRSPVQLQRLKVRLWNQISKLICEAKYFFFYQKMLKLAN